MVGVPRVRGKGDGNVLGGRVLEHVLEELDSIHRLCVVSSGRQGDRKVAALVRMREERLRKALLDLERATAVCGLQAALVLHRAVAARAVHVAVLEFETRNGRPQGGRWLEEGLGRE
jgi:hypothetical protein